MPIYHTNLPLYRTNEIRELAKAVHDEMYSIENTLKRRGYIYSDEGRVDQVILPSSRSDIDRSFRYMARRTFRNILKKVATKKRDIQQGDFAAECSQTKLLKYFTFFENSGILRKDTPSSFCLARDASDFGHTLEWYVAELFKKELRCTAAWNVRVKDISLGGDFDVLAR